ncbi:hypothetical protein H2198_000061 [Neophaeococcomyces mojaviensis]|uniref:Uncharacterized protein n=1 Tax=Neophaeococcomyces mojaviensis TaxID=3383035 RepID=A0ACC3AL47_9EURO|nr:hypothetical protein H2198_000061 [Knufia sp. JES_112]
MSSRREAVLAFLITFPIAITAHIAAFAPGMYCRNGLTGDNNNSNDPVAPLYELSQSDWWFQHSRGCDAHPPPEDEFLELPAGGSFTVQHANNQAFSSLSYGGSLVTQWPDGGNHPDDWHGDWDGAECLPGGGWMHAQNESMAQGTAFAIAYESDLSKIAMEDLVVFSVLAHTPWHTTANYQVPAALQACPAGGCTCAWLWVPKGCGQANMYMQGFKCNVTNVDESIAKPLAKAQPAKWCKDNQASCVSGPKQMIVFNQLEGDNVNGIPQYETPVYNDACGFKAGAQNDIFDGSAAPAHTTTTSATAASTTSIKSTTVSPSATTVSISATKSINTGAHPISNPTSGASSMSNILSSTKSSADFSILPISTSIISSKTPDASSNCAAPTSVVTVTVTVTATSLTPDATSTGTKSTSRNGHKRTSREDWRTWKA